MRLLKSTVAAPDVRLHRLGILAPEERRQLVEGFSATEHLVAEGTVVELVEAQVARAPEAVAVVFGEASLTYAELNAQANRLAHCLIGLGVGPESLVCLCVERGLEMMIGVLAEGSIISPRIFISISIYRPQTFCNLCVLSTFV